MAISNFSPDAVMLWGIFFFIDLPISELVLIIIKNIETFMDRIEYNYMLEKICILKVIFGFFGTFTIFFTRTISGQIISCCSKKEILTIFCHFGIFKGRISKNIL
jgi:hypothetical protein